MIFPVNFHLKWIFHSYDNRHTPGSRFFEVNWPKGSVEAVDCLKQLAQFDLATIFSRDMDIYSISDIYCIFTHSIWKATLW